MQRGGENHLENEQRNWFTYRCVCNDLALCESILQSILILEGLFRGKNKRHIAIVFSVYGGYLETVELLYKYNVELQNINKEGKTPLMVALS